MRIQKSVKKAIDELNNRDYESAMLHVCNAIDGTAQKKSGKQSSAACFKNYIRGYYEQIAALSGTYSLEYPKSIFPISKRDQWREIEKPDLADMLYHTHRCSHGHGVPAPVGFEFIEDVANGSDKTTIGFEKGSVQLSDRFIWALIWIVILEPVNKEFSDLELDGYWMNLGGNKLIVNEWWGRLNDLPPLPPKTKRIILDCSKIE